MTMAGLSELRSAAARIRLPERGVLEVTGDDRARWLDGMLTNAVADLAVSGGCRALALTRTGRIVADPHVLARDTAYWLELEGTAIPALREHLDSFLVADDVELRDTSAEWTRFAIEGPGALAAWEQAGLAVPQPGGAAEASVGGVSILAAAYSLSGLGGIQVFAPAASAETVWQGLASAADVDAAAVALELVRIEQGEPRLGRELGPDVLPAEARLEAAVSETKGCYTGQEVVARMRSRDRVSHLLVGLSFAGEPPAPGSPLEAEGKRRGEVTSAGQSDRFGPIGLGYVTRALAEPGTVLSAAGTDARVVALPFDSSAVAAPDEAR